MGTYGQLIEDMAVAARLLERINYMYPYRRDLWSPRELEREIEYLRRHTEPEEVVDLAEEG